MNRMLKKLDRVFNPKSIAVVGASAIPAKVGNVVLKNFIDGGYSGKIYPVNPKYETLLGFRCYKTIKDTNDRIDCVIIATPAPTVPSIIKECGEMDAGGVVVLSGGFEEAGRKDLAEEIKRYANKYELPVIGPNCLGVYDTYTRVDSIFFPFYKMERPKPGAISFITQSGAVGSTVIDLAAYYGIGMAKFISYGNATVLDEGELLEYLEKDRQTKIIVLYLEGTKNGKTLLRTLKRVNQKKPIIVLKAGKYGKALEAAKSHTGNLAGDYMAYQAVFKQTKVTEAEDIDELFDFVKIFNQTLPKGNRIGVITNGGGLGVLTTDAIEKEGLQMAELSESTKSTLKGIMPAYGTISNPLDIIADATVELYEKSIETFMNDQKIDALIVVVLTQAPPIDERIIGVLTRASDDKRKPVAVIAVGGAYTQTYKKALESRGVPTYDSAQSAVKALKRFVNYAESR